MQTNESRSIQYTEEEKEEQEADEQYFNAANTSSSIQQFPQLPPDTFCVPWNHPDVDEWWTHHFEYEQGAENRTHQCFDRIVDTKKLLLWARLYQNQWQTSPDCSNLHVRMLWNSGWGADLWNVEGSLIDLLDNTRNPNQHPKPKPLVMMVKPNEVWQYANAAGKAGKAPTQQPVCPRGDLSCYFLPLSSCDSAVDHIPYDDSFMDNTNFTYRHSHVVYEYITRPLQWLRHALYEFRQNPTVASTHTASQPPQSCSVLHVRRADIVLLDPDRSYYSIETYLQQLPQPDHAAAAAPVLLLLTDDQNAVDEAREFHPDLDWRILDRPRHRGAEAGWEHQIPSLDPQHEVVTILGTLEWVRGCSILVRQKGNFADLIERSMRSAQHGRLKVFYVDTDHDEGHGWNTTIHEQSAEKLKQALEAKRKERMGNQTNSSTVGQ